MATTDLLNLPKPDDRTEDKQSVAEAFLETALALDMLDAIVHGQGVTLSGKAAVNHTHAIGDVEGLTDALAGKMPADTTFGIADLDDVVGFAAAPDGYVLTKSGGQMMMASPAAAIGAHGHLIGDITGLETTLAGIASDIDGLETDKMAIAGTYLFTKADPYAVAFNKTGNDTISVKSGTVVEVDGKVYTFASDTAVTMPSLTAGSDYAIWIKPDGSLEATSSFSSPPVASSRRMGGFHYAPGGNAAAYNSGGNTTPQINEFSIWDEKFRPSCPDPRGMALVAGKFWVDIYLCGVNHHTDGTSKYNVTIADGSSPPKVPTMFGGNGSTAYSQLNWWEAAEVMTSHGKDLLTNDEFAAAAYGTREGIDGATDPVSTILRANFTSKWGMMLSTGNMWVWSRDFSYRYDSNSSFSWKPETGGRGSVYSQGTYGLVVALLGGYWDDGSDAGSRASRWVNSPWNSLVNIGARGRSDHLCHV